MEEHGAAFVCADAPQGKAPTMMPPVDAVTRDDLAYFRAHGRNVEGYMRGKSVAERFGWDYGDDELRELAGGRGSAEVPEVRMMFNNNRGATRRAPSASASWWPRDAKAALLDAIADGDPRPRPVRLRDLRGGDEPRARARATPTPTS